MLKRLLLTYLALQGVAFGQRQLSPLTHLDSKNGLNQATVTALVEDELGQIWIGTHDALCLWDGIEVSEVKNNSNLVMRLHALDSCIYSLELNSLRRINIYSGDEKVFPLPYSNYRYCNFKEDRILTISSNLKDTIVVDYDFNKLINNLGQHEELSLNRSIQIGDKSVQMIRSKAYLINEDSVQLSNTIVNDMVQFDLNTVFISSQEGLIELKYENGEITRKLHLSDQRIENLLIDRNNNLWVGTAESGLFLFHRNVIVNEYYPQNENGDRATSCWTIVEVDKKIYVCTSNGLRLISNEYEEIQPLEKATDGIFCIAAIDAKDFVLIGTAKDGLYKFQNNKLTRIYYNQNDAFDNTVIQIHKDGDSFLILTKRAIHRLDRSGKLISSGWFKRDQETFYVMDLKKSSTSYLAATTVGMLEYDSSLDPIKLHHSKSARVFANVLRHNDVWWCASMDDGLYEFTEDSLVPKALTRRKLLDLESCGSDMWITTISSSIQFNSSNFVEYTVENGFPLLEYSQGGLFNRGDSLLYFSGIGGVFLYNPKHSEYELQLPKWVIKIDDQLATDQSRIQLNHDQSRITIEAKTLVLSDRNHFEIHCEVNGARREFLNGNPFNLNLEYGPSSVRFIVKNSTTGETGSYVVNLDRSLPFWMSVWFAILLSVLVIFALIGIYFLFRFFKTRKLLKQEEEQRKLSQERLRISRELHDNIGSRLTHIISSLDIELHKNEQDNYTLESINSFAKETMRQLRETIWAVSDKTIFFSEFLQRVDQYIIQSDQMTSIRLRFDNQCQSDFELNATQTINFFRIIQEAINNAIKYSQAEKLEVIIREDESSAMISIIDNGIGFNSKKVAAGTGLRGMAARTEEVGAQLDVNSNENQGTTIRITFEHE